jgi:hypothetical protein
LWGALPYFSQAAGKQNPEEFETGGGPNILMSALNAGAFAITGLEGVMTFESFEAGREMEVRG